MINCKKTILFFFALSYFSLFGQNGPAIIKDKDGYTNLRKGPGTNFKVIDTLFNEDFFYYQYVGKGNWAKVSGWKGKPLEGFIHTSRIQEIRNLKPLEQKEIILKVLNRQKVLAKRFRNAWKENKKLNSFRIQLENYTDAKYDPLLDLVPEYFCKTNDSEIILAQFENLSANEGSANELPPISIGKCFICKPTSVIKELSKIKNLEKRKLILNHIEFGLVNEFLVDENGNSEDPEYNKLKNLLDEERKKARP